MMQLNHNDNIIIVWRVKRILPWKYFKGLRQRFSNYSPRTTRGPSKKTEWKIIFKWIAYDTVTENLRVWKWHMAIAFHFFSQYWHFMKFITLLIYRLPSLLSATKEGFKALCTWYFSPSFHCTSGSAPVTQPGTTRIHNRGPKYRTFSCIYDFLTVILLPANIQI